MPIYTVKFQASTENAAFQAFSCVRKVCLADLVLLSEAASAAEL